MPSSTMASYTTPPSDISTMPSSTMPSSTMASYTMAPINTPLPTDVTPTPTLSSNINELLSTPITKFKCDNNFNALYRANYCINSLNREILNESNIQNKSELKQKIVNFKTIKSDISSIVDEECVGITPPFTQDSYSCI
jgi:hypothetical protein